MYINYSYLNNYSLKLSLGYAKLLLFATKENAVSKLHLFNFII